MNDLFHIAQRLYNVPLLIAPEKAQIILHVLEGRIGNSLDLALDESVVSPEMSRFVGSPVRSDGAPRKFMVDQGVAVVPVIGSLVNRGAWLGARSGMTSYEGLTAQLRDAAADPDVSSILLDIDSPGGEATGMFSLAAMIQSIREQKPVVAVVNDVAASAAYGLASAASQIVVSPTSLAGSIGVVYLHVDESAKLEKEGVKPTLIYAGARKVDGSPYSPLSEAARSEIQSRVHGFYDRFLSLVEQGRGARFGADAARSTEARVLMGEEAVAAGMADRVASFDQILSEFQGYPRKRQLNTRRTVTMSSDAGSPAATTAGITEAERAAIRAEGASAEYARIMGILNCEAATGRERTAIRLAGERAMSAEGAAAILGSLPVAASIEARAAAMPEIGATDSPANPEASAEVARSGWDKAFARTPAKKR